MCDRKGVIYKGRDNVDQFKSAHLIETKHRTLADAMKDADVFLGLSAKRDEKIIKVQLFLLVLIQTPKSSQRKFLKLEMMQ